MPPGYSRYSMFNVRAETLTGSPACRGPFRNQHCVIPASSFIEWRQEGGIRQPYAIRPSHGAIAFAGLWDRWARDNEEIFSCTLITTDAAPGMEEIHNRQPVMLPRDALDKWLDPSIDGRDLMPIQRPGIPDDLEVTAVDWMINNSREKHKPAPLIDREVFTIGSC